MHVKDENNLTKNTIILSKIKAIRDDDREKYHNIFEEIKIKQCIYTNNVAYLKWRRVNRKRSTELLPSGDLNQWPVGWFRLQQWDLWEAWSKANFLSLTGIGLNLPTLFLIYFVKLTYCVWYSCLLVRHMYETFATKR